MSVWSHIFDPVRLCVHLEDDEPGEGEDKVVKEDDADHDGHPLLPLHPPPLGPHHWAVRRQAAPRHGEGHGPGPWGHAQVCRGLMDHLLMGKRLESQI